MKWRNFYSMACEEPFRIFFPIGLLLGVLGVLLWPLHFMGIYGAYPSGVHSRLMVEGFLGAFIFGFLGTAGPRLSGTDHFSGKELGALLALFVTSQGAHLLRVPRLGDLCFFILLLVFSATLGKRLFRARGILPPGFILVAIGFASAITGSGLLAGGAMGLVPPRLIFLGNTLLNEVWVLFLVIGVGSFLLPRFLNLSPAALRRSSGNWKEAAISAGVAGVVMLLTYGFQTFGLISVSAGALLRFLTAGIYFYFQMGLLKLPSLTMMRCFYIAVVMTLLGLLFPVFWPAQRLAGLHLLFIGGFALLTLTVATRVIFGHGGHSHRFQEKLPFLSIMALLFLFAMTLRIGGDAILPAWRQGILNISALLWTAGAAVWGWHVIPKVTSSEPETLPSCSENP